MAFLLEALAQAGQSVSALRACIPVCAMVKEKFACRARDVAWSVRLLRRVYRDEELDTLDGVKVSWPDRWVHIRGSNTEPVIRIVAEARTEPEAKALVQNVLEYLRPHAQ